MKKLVLLALIFAGTLLQASPADDLARRIMGRKAARFEFVDSPADKDFFQVEQAGRKIRITGNNVNSQAMGLNWYLKHVAHVHVSWFEDQPVQLPWRLPRVKTPVRRDARVQDRFFLNYCTYGYTMPWWGWKQWERFIDWMAMNGVTLPLAITGQEAVWYEVWKEFGMTDEEIRSYFSGPAHLPWHRMANLDGFQGPLPVSWLEGQKALQGRIVTRERELGMTPVLPGFAGHVPGRIAELFPEAGAGFPGKETVQSVLEQDAAAFLQSQAAGPAFLGQGVQDRLHLAHFVPLTGAGSLRAQGFFGELSERLILPV